MITFTANLISLESYNKCQNLIILSIIRSVCIYWGIKHDKKQVVAERDPMMWTRFGSSGPLITTKTGLFSHTHSLLYSILYMVHLRKRSVSPYIGFH